MNPPNVYELTIPNSQRINSITAIVQSIGIPFRQVSVVLLTQQLTGVYARGNNAGIQ
jgi:hypothetical protein